ncbi:hypothetical protein FH972_008445 [Carpinus fangiana]|uniref:Uncharacterized protein n=1 Tax=Carpinus fangiana TaxID=176857 RepID=A0A5N6R122_9ROSI|nr:hypothetical protein FH972_008445 [Carpinus fangiana]
MDSSGLFESQASINSNELEQTETIICMDRDSYKAAAKGKVEVFNAKGETPLHIVTRYGHVAIVAVLIKYCSQTLHQNLEDGIEPVKEMLGMTNKDTDTALHEVVRYNHLKVVKKTQIFHILLMMLVRLHFPLLPRGFKDVFF